MASKQFYLLGEAPSTARTIEFEQSTDFDDLRHIVASHFAIVDPYGKNNPHLSDHTIHS
jgi:hypothetical protein